MWRRDGYVKCGRLLQPPGQGPTVQPDGGRVAKNGLVLDAVGQQLAAFRECGRLANTTYSPDGMIEVASSRPVRRDSRLFGFESAKRAIV